MVQRGPLAPTGAGPARPPGRWRGGRTRGRGARKGKRMPLEVREPGGKAGNAAGSAPARGAGRQPRVTRRRAETARRAFHRCTIRADPSPRLGSRPSPSRMEKPGKSRIPYRFPRYLVWHVWGPRTTLFGNGTEFWSRGVAASGRARPRGPLLPPGGGHRAGGAPRPQPGEPAGGGVPAPPRAPRGPPCPARAGGTGAAPRNAQGPETGRGPGWGRNSQRELVKQAG